MLLGGELVEGKGSPIEVVDPSSEEPIASIASASPDQVAAAIASAKEAFPGWKLTPAPDRGEMLQALARWMRDHTEELAITLTKEGGKPLVENRDEIGWSASCLDFYAVLGR
ncbi:MAG: hypothetical protein QOH90_1346, partial [Actinomycetota bacterium]|nr:hypothetical protein [Actinomycetota bacterium]